MLAGNAERTVNMVTMSDVAAEAGVSKSTVSLVISGKRPISASTTARVYDAMDKLGYTMNHAARALSTSRTMTLGVAIPWTSGGFATLTQGTYLCTLAAFAKQRGYRTLLISDEDGAESLRDAALGKQIDGVVLMEVRDEGDPRVDVIHELGLPAVLLGNPKESQGIDSVDSDFADEATRLIDHLGSRGHTNVLMVLGPQSIFDQQQSYALRFRDAAMHAATSWGMHLIGESVEDSDDPAEALRITLRRHPDVTAILIHNDAAAIVAPQLLNEMGVRVPDDLSVATIISGQLRRRTHIPYTSVDVDLPRITKETINVLVNRLEHPDAPLVRRILNHPLVDRNSVRSL